MNKSNNEMMNTNYEVYDKKRMQNINKRAGIMDDENRKEKSKKREIMRIKGKRKGNECPFGLEDELTGFYSSLNRGNNFSNLNGYAQKNESKVLYEEKKKGKGKQKDAFISKEFIKNLGICYNIINDKTQFEKESCFESISSVIEFRIKQIIEEANKFYEKRKRFCINKFLNVNDFINSCNYLNVTIPYVYKNNFRYTYCTTNKNYKDGKIIYRLISKQKHKHKFKKKRKILKKKKGKELSDFLLSYSFRNYGKKGETHGEKVDEGKEINAEGAQEVIKNETSEVTCEKVNEVVQEETKKEVKESKKEKLDEMKKEVKETEGDETKKEDTEAKEEATKKEDTEVKEEATKKEDTEVKEEATKKEDTEVKEEATRKEDTEVKKEKGSKGESPTYFQDKEYETEKDTVDEELKKTNKRKRENVLNNEVPFIKQDEVNEYNHEEGKQKEPNIELNGNLFSGDIVFEGKKLSIQWEDSANGECTADLVKEKEMLEGEKGHKEGFTKVDFTTEEHTVEDVKNYVEDEQNKYVKIKKEIIDDNSKHEEKEEKETDTIIEKRVKEEKNENGKEEKLTTNEIKEEVTENGSTIERIEEEESKKKTEKQERKEEEAEKGKENNELEREQGEKTEEEKERKEILRKEESELKQKNQKERDEEGANIKIKNENKEDANMEKQIENEESVNVMKKKEMDTQNNQIVPFEIHQYEMESDKIVEISKEGNFVHEIEENQKEIYKENPIEEQMNEMTNQQIQEMVIEHMEENRENKDEHEKEKEDNTKYITPEMVYMLRKWDTANENDVKEINNYVIEEERQQINENDYLQNLPSSKIETEKEKEINNNSLYKSYINNTENNKMDVLRFLLSDMQNFLPVEPTLTILWVYIQNRYKKRTKKKDKKEKGKKKKSIISDYQCYEILYSIKIKKQDKKDKKKRKGKKNYSLHYNSAKYTNIFVLPKFNGISKEYTILLKYIIEIIKDIINYRTQFFDYNNILHIFSTSKEINKILSNILFFLFNELDHNIRMNNVYAALMLLILLKGLVTNRNLDIDLYCLPILKLFIHIILYEYDLKLKNIYGIISLKRKVCDIINEFCFILRCKNNCEMVNIDSYIIYILGKLLTHEKCTYMHIYVSYYLIYLMPIHIHMKFFLCFTPNFLPVFFKKYLYYQNTYDCSLSSSERETIELYNFFFFHIYTLIQGSLYKIYKNINLLITTSCMSSYLNYIWRFLTKHSDYHLPLLLSVFNFLHNKNEYLIRGTRNMNNKNSCQYVDILKFKKLQYEQKKDDSYFLKKQNYISSIKELNEYYSGGENDFDDIEYDNVYGSRFKVNSCNGDTENSLIMKNRMKLNEFIQKRAKQNRKMLKKRWKANQIHTNIAVDTVLQSILNGFERDNMEYTQVTVNHVVDDSYTDTSYYFLYTF